MYVKKISLTGFRNYTKQEIELNKDINILYGNNAQGKTNLLESIYICALGKSYRTNKDKELVNVKSDFAKVNIDFQKEDRDGKIEVCVSDKKEILLNNIKVKKMSEILGNVNIVLFSPDDINIFRDVPARRRKLLDVMISQLRPKYVYSLNMYKKVLEQRNNYLKQIKFENKSEEMLDIWEEKQAECAEIINLYRKEFIEKIKAKIGDIHLKVTNGKEKIDLKYISDYTTKEKFLNKMRENRKIDIMKGFTGIGVHRDDLKLFINSDYIGTYGSQGQHRSAILSIKLSELEIVREEVDENPILLLDDFMSELDKERRRNFLEDIKGTQVIITCTDELELKNENKRLFFVENGTIKEQK